MSYGNNKLTLRSQNSQWENEKSVWIVRAASPEVSTSNTPTNKGTNQSTSGSPKSPVGYACLFGVALLWGSYTPALRYLYLIDE